MEDTRTRLGQTCDMAREILEGMSEYRIDPTMIKTTEDTPKFKGGQGAVVVGTLSSSARAKEIVSVDMTEHGTGDEGGGELAADRGMDLKKVLEEPESKRPSTEELEEILHDSQATTEMPAIHAEGQEDQLPERAVAIKILEWNRDDLQESTKFFKSFVNELKLMTTLSHPNIIGLVGFVEDMEKGHAWIILPWQGNGNVREFLHSGEWDIPERISLIQDTAKGLEYLHSHQPPICHGDLKSLNILVTSSYHAVITDFGSARFKQDVASKERENQSDLPNAALVNDGSAAGWPSPEVKFNPSTLELTLTGPLFSLRWTAPEVLAGEYQDLPSDMWAMGWICWEIVTGKIPFEELNTEKTIVKHTIEGKLPAIREDFDLSHVLRLCGLMTECWAPRPDKRIDGSAFRRKVHILPSETPSGHVSGGQKRRSASLLAQLGQIYSLQGKYQEAMSYYQSAVDVAIRTEDEVAKGHALNLLGDVYGVESRYSEAEQTLLEAHNIQSRIGSSGGVASVLRGLGDVYWAQSKHDEAEKALTEAYEMYSRIGDILGAAHALTRLGRIFKAHTTEGAEEAFKDAYAMHSRFGEDAGAADALHSLGHLYRTQSKHDEAEKPFIEAHEIRYRIGDHDGAANVLVDLGHVYQAQSKHPEAEKAFIEAYKIHSRIGNHMDAAEASFDLGQTYYAQSKHSEAEKAFTKAHEIHSRISNHLGAAAALLNLGHTYLKQSNTQEAEKVFNDACKILPLIDNSLATGAIFRSLGRLYQDQCRFDKAEMFYRQALAAYYRADDAENISNTLLTLGFLYHAQERYLEADEAVSEALAIRTSLGDEEGQGHLYLVLAFIFKSQSKHAEVTDALIQAEAALARTSQGDAHAMTLDWLGDIHAEQGMYAEAEEYYRHAQAIFSSMEDARGEAGELLSLGLLYIRQLRLGEAEECFVQARVAFAVVADEDGEAKALDKLMGVYALQRKFRDAKVVCMEACEMYAQRGQPMSEMCVKIWKMVQNLEE